MITTIMYNASGRQLLEAREYTASHLHIPLSVVTNLVAVAYVCQHFSMGLDMTGWDGFVTYMEL